MDNIIDTLCIGGGAIKGFSYLAALHVLISHNYINLDLINKYTGTSVGSIFCFLLSIGYTTEELLVYFNNFDKKDLDVNLDLELFLSKHGFNDGSNYMSMVTTLFNLKTKLKDINFKDLEILTKKKIYIIVTNFTKGQKEIFSYETSPEMSVLLAIRISISIPLLLTPIIYNDNYYIDGCLTSNYGIEYCNLKTTLCICLQKPKCFSYDNISNIISGIMTIVMLKDLNDLKKLEIIQNECFNAVNLDDDSYKNLLNIGTKSALKFLKKEYILKIKEKEIELNILKKNINIKDNIISNEIENIHKKYIKLEIEETLIVNEEQNELNNKHKHNNTINDTINDTINTEVKSYIYELINLIDNKII
jgi:predicted patatin/cPLA2 family phospholipase